MVCNQKANTEKRNQSIETKLQYRNMSRFTKINDNDTYFKCQLVEVTC